MLVHILSTIHNITTLLFGIFISAFLLGVTQNRKNVVILFMFSLCECFLFILSNVMFGANFSDCIYPMIYPLLVHLPLVIFLVCYYKFSVISAGISVCSAYLCCQISNWGGLLVVSLIDIEWCYYFARIVITMATFFFLCRFVCHTTALIFTKDKRELCVISVFPFVYYVFDYASTKFTGLLYSGNKAIVEFMGFAFCIAYLAFLLIYFKEYEQKQEIRQYSDLMEMQLLSIQNEIKSVESSKKAMSILRHDTRHHLNTIMTLLQNENVDKVKDYITEIGDAYEDTIVKTYSKNEMLNSVLSLYQMRYVDKGFTLECAISCDSLPFTEIAFCAILSNALENAMHSLEDIETGEKKAKLTIFRKENNILLQLENPTAKCPVFVDGIPVSNRTGHGIGAKSIVYYVEQLQGQWQFSCVDNMFVLKIII